MTSSVQSFLAKPSPTVENFKAGSFWARYESASSLTHRPYDAYIEQVKSAAISLVDAFRPVIASIMFADLLGQTLVIEKWPPFEPFYKSHLETLVATSPAVEAKIKADQWRADRIFRLNIGLNVQCRAFLSESFQPMDTWQLSMTRNTRDVYAQLAQTTTDLFMKSVYSNGNQELERLVSDIEVIRDLVWKELVPESTELFSALERETDQLAPLYVSGTATDAQVTRLRHNHDAFLKVGYPKRTGTYWPMNPDPFYVSMGAFIAKHGLQLKSEGFRMSIVDEPDARKKAAAGR